MHEWWRDGNDYIMTQLHDYMIVCAPSFSHGGVLLVAIVGESAMIEAVLEVEAAEGEARGVEKRKWQ